MNGWTSGSLPAVAAWGKRRGATSPRRPSWRRPGSCPPGRPGISPPACGRHRAAASPAGSAGRRTPSAPGGERAGRRCPTWPRRRHPPGDGDRAIGVFLTDLPSATRVRTEADAEHRVALCRACPWLPASSDTGRAGRRVPGSPPSAVRRPGGNPGTSATLHQGCVRPPGPGRGAPTAPGRWSPGPCTPAAPPSETSATCRVLTVSRARAETRRCRSATKRWRGTRTGAVAARRAHRAEGHECLEVCDECRPLPREP